MFQETSILITTASFLGFFHTVMGPDHYLPFIVMSRAQKWSWSKTALATFLCGVAHILSSLVLGLIGIVFGIAASKLAVVEEIRGNIAAWFLIAFGSVYFAWGLRQALRNRSHSHRHAHEGGLVHFHEHTHFEEHMHVHPVRDLRLIPNGVHERENFNLTPWILFTVFIFGPCEVLIPLVMYPAATNSFSNLFWVVGAFGLTTVATMLAMVLVSSFGLIRLSLGRFNRYDHALAGMAIFVCGLAVQFLGL